jgi:hypothetical protein
VASFGRGGMNQPISLSLMPFPQPLTGSNFKETGLYMDLPGRDRMRDRVKGFPFVDEGESFVTTDGTVHYLGGYSAFEIAAER